MNAIQQAIDQIADIHEAVNAPRDGDYLKDGLLYCHKCNTPKQCRISCFGVERVVSCACICESERREKKKAAQKQWEFQAMVRRNRKDAFGDESMSDKVFERDDMRNPKLTKAMKTYAEQFDRFYKQSKGLLLYGTNGTGKTFAAICVANALLDRGYTVLCTSAVILVNCIGSTFEKQEYIRSLNTYKLLVIDDLGAERDTETAQQYIFDVIDSRYRSGKPVIITTNLTGPELENPMNKAEKPDAAKRRIYSRLMEMCHPIEVNGADRRKLMLKDTHQSMKDILGM